MIKVFVFVIWMMLSAQVAWAAKPKGIEAKAERISIEGTNVWKIELSGIDKEAVGQLAAEIRAVRPPEPYKGKGIRYEGERIIRKAGKSFQSGA